MILIVLVRLGVGVGGAVGIEVGLGDGIGEGEGDSIGDGLGEGAAVGDGLGAGVELGVGLGMGNVHNLGFFAQKSFTLHPPIAMRGSVNMLIRLDFEIFISLFLLGIF